MADQALPLGGDTPTLALLRFSIALARDDFDTAADEGQTMYEISLQDEDPSWRIAAAGFRLDGAVMADPTDTRISEYVAEIDDLMDASDWPSGLAKCLLSHVMVSMMMGDADAMGRYRADLD